jgi:hypothetical protein
VSIERSSVIDFPSDSSFAPTRRRWETPKVILPADGIWDCEKVFNTHKRYFRNHKPLLLVHLEFMRVGDPATVVSVVDLTHRSRHAIDTHPLSSKGFRKV